MALADTGNEYDSVISSVFVAARLIFAISKPLAPKSSLPDLL